MIRRFVLSILLVAGVGVAAWWIRGSTGYPHRWVIVLYVMSGAALIGSLLCGSWGVLRDVRQLYKASGGIKQMVALALVAKLTIASAGVQSPAMLDTLTEQVGQQQERLEALEQQRQQDQAEIARLKSEIAFQKTEIALLKIPLPRAATGLLLGLVGILLATAASVVWAAGIA